jgi:NhaP-type Na+/H+ or K+/H+ antiporter
MIVFLALLLLATALEVSGSAGGTSGKAEGNSTAKHTVHHTGGQGEIHMITFTLFLGFVLYQNQPNLCRGALPYTVWLLLAGGIIGVTHMITITDRSKSPEVYAGHVFSTNECDETLPTCTSMWTGTFFKLNLLSDIDPHAVMYIFLPPLIFESAFYVDVHIFLRALKSIIAMAVIGVLVASGVTAALVAVVYPNYTLNEKVDLTVYGELFPALLLGTTLSATDPVAVVGLLNSLGAPKALATLIEGESLLNDGTAYGFFLLFFELTRYTHAFEHTPEAICSETNPLNGCIKDYRTVTPIVIMLVNLVVTANVLGFLVAHVALFAIKFTPNNNMIDCIVTLVAAYSSWIVAEACSASGVLSVVVCGAIMNMHKSTIREESREFIKEFWETICYILNTVLFVVSGIYIGVTVLNTHNRIAIAKDIWLCFILYVIIHVARACSLTLLQPCLNKRCCGGKYSSYDFGYSHSIIMWWGGLRGAVGLALAIIVGNDPLWLSMDEAYCKKNLCCGDGTEGSGSCWQRKMYYQTAFGEIFPFHIAFIVMATIVVNGVSTGSCVKKFNLGKKTTKLDEINFTRVCLEIDEELHEKMKKLAATETEVMAQEPSKDASRIDWKQVYRYMPIADKIVFDRRMDEGLIEPMFGHKSDVDMPPRLRPAWVEYQKEYGAVPATVDIGARKRTVIEQLSLHQKSLSDQNFSPGIMALQSEAVALADLRVKYINLVKGKYWELLREGYLTPGDLTVLKAVEEAMKDTVDDHITQMHTKSFARGVDDLEGLQQAYLGGGGLCSFAYLAPHVVLPQTPLYFIMRLMRWKIIGLTEMLGMILNYFVTRDYRIVENYIHGHKTAIHYLLTRHKGLVDDDTLARVLNEAEMQVAEAQTKLDGLGKVYESVIERHETVTAAEVMLSYQEKIVREKEEEGELSEENAHTLYRQISISKMRLKSHPLPKKMSTPLKDHLDKALLENKTAANFLNYMNLRLDPEDFEELKLNIVKFADNNPVYLRAHDVVYVKEKSDLHLGFDLFNLNALAFYFVVKGNVSIVSFDDEVELSIEERERQYQNIRKTNRRALDEGGTSDESPGETDGKRDKASKHWAKATKIMGSFTKWVSQHKKQPSNVAEIENLLAIFKSKQHERHKLSIIERRLKVHYHRVRKTLGGRLNKALSESDQRKVEMEHEAIINHLRVLSKSGTNVKLVEMAQNSNTFGEFGIQCGLEARKFTAVCNTDCLLYYVTPQKLTSLWKKYPEINDFIAMRALQHSVLQASEVLYSQHEGLEEAMKYIHRGCILNDRIDVKVSAKENSFCVHMTYGGTDLQCATGPTSISLSEDRFGILFSADDKNIYSPSGNVLTDIFVGKNSRTPNKSLKMKTKSSESVEMRELKSSYQV